ncbi:MAG: NifU family protein [Bryobacteraceae bacterium]|jgi:Fe-S cluster biogenesis protein NfuA
MPGQPEFPQRIQSIERMLGEIEGSADLGLRTSVRQLVQSVMDLHGAGLDRILELIRSDAAGGEGLVEKLGRDELVASLLVLYGLHPLNLEARITEGLDKARARLRSHQGEVELLSVQDGVVRLRLHANGHGCGSTAQALKELVEDAVYQCAPDIASLVIEDAGEKPGFVSLELLQKTASAPQMTVGNKGAL